MSNAVLVIGGGIAGIQAALDLAEAGIRVHLVERSPSVGGRMAQLDKTLPTNDCSICILSPNLVAAARHPNIEILTFSEVAGLEGEPGDFHVTVKRHPRYIDEDRCLACSECIDGCVYKEGKFPNPFDMGLGLRKPVYVPFPQAVPAMPLIDPAACIFLKTGKCPQTCVDACGDRNAIDFDQKERYVELDVAAVTVATGFDEFDPSGLTRYGYGRYDNVVTGLEFERLLNAAGPTQGHVRRPSDGRAPESLFFVQCVGSREQANNPFCSRVCCTYSIKQCMIAKDHEPGIKDLHLAYIDLRTYGKGFEDYARRGRDETGVNFIHGKPARISEDPGSRDLVIHMEDRETGRPVRIPTEMAVLSCAMVSSAAVRSLAEVLAVETDEHGFFVQRHINFDPIGSTRDGVLLCGCAECPKDIPDSVAQASACAAAAARFVSGRVAREKTEVAPVDTSGEPRVGVFVCHCGKNIGGVVDVPSVAEYARTLPYVVHASDNMFTCADDTQKKMAAAIVEHRLNRVVVAACSPRTHEPIFRETCAGVGLNPYLFEMANIRDQCSWVHAHVPAQATRKARDLVRMAVARAAMLDPLETQQVDVTQRVLVIGGGITGIETALALARQGIDVCIVETEAELGGRLRHIHRLYPDGASARARLAAKLAELDALGVDVVSRAAITAIDGFVGNFTVHVNDLGADEQVAAKTIEAGALVLAIGADVYQPQGEYGYGRYPNVITNVELERLLAAADAETDSEGATVDARADSPEIAATPSGADTTQPGGGELFIDGRKPGTVAFFQCVGSRERDTPNSGCSRYCCQTAIKQAIALRQRGIDVAIFYRDLRAFSRKMEEQYRRAREMGVLFLRFDVDDRPRVEGDGRAERVVLNSPVLHEELELDIDAAVLSVGMVPRQAETERLHEMLKVPTGPDGFFMERHIKLGPVETNTEGIYVAGCAQGPKDIADSVAQAAAAAAKAAILVSRDTKQLDAVTCRVVSELCRACGECIEVCEYNAPLLIDLNGVRVSSINPALCKGCGTCAARCPTGAIVADHFTDRQVESVIDALLLEETVLV